MEKEILKVIGKNIKKYRKLCGYTQERLSELADVHPATIGRLEGGGINVTVLKLQKISKILNIEVKDLFQ